jgi:hypothetical protein
MFRPPIPGFLTYLQNTHPLKSLSAVPLFCKQLALNATHTCTHTRTHTHAHTHAHTHKRSDIHKHNTQVLSRQLVHRAAQLGPVRSVHQLSRGFLEAPSSSAAICFMSVGCQKALEMWNPEVTAAAFEIWHTTVQDALTK